MLMWIPSYKKWWIVILLLIADMAMFIVQFFFPQGNQILKQGIILQFFLNLFVISMTLFYNNQLKSFMEMIKRQNVPLDLIKMVRVK